MFDLEFEKLEFEYVVKEIERLKKELTTNTEVKKFKELSEHLEGLESDKKKLIRVLGL